MGEFFPTREDMCLFTQDLRNCHVSSIKIGRKQTTEAFLNKKFSQISLCSKGLAKLGNIVAETLLRRQMFSSLAARETCVGETNFAARKQENVFSSGHKHFCNLDTNFASETYVSQFSHHESNVDLATKSVYYYAHV